MSGWARGFNFRDTAGYVTDVSETYVLGADTYPPTRGGVTFGWDSAATGIDRDNTNDRRIAGIHYAFGTLTFRVDLPNPADFLIHLGLGDTSQAPDHSQIDVQDTAAPVLTVTNDRNVGPYRWTDATGTQYSFANWPSSEAPVQRTFATAILNAVLSTPDGAWTLSHIALSEVASAVSPARILFRNRAYV
jgi:hypothetical protein